MLFLNRTFGRRKQCYSFLIFKPICAVVFFCWFALSFPSGTREAQSQPDNRPAPASITPAPQTANLSTRNAAQSTRRITEYALPPALYTKAKTLGTIRFTFRLFSFFYALFALWLILQTHLSAKFRDWAEARTRNRFLQALIYTPLLAVAFGLLQLPLDLFSESLMKHYGISVQRWSSWTGDWFKTQLLIMVIGSLFAWILFAMIRRSPNRWWFYFWAISIPIFLFIFFLQPVIIDPMFNKFEPLSAKAPELIPQLQQVAERGGMPIAPERMSWMLASDKTIYTNAYVTGVGATKRVVIWDTTLAKETSGGILTMFGHEMGHYVLHHIWKGLAFVSAVAFVLLYLGYRTSGWLLARYAARWGVREIDDCAALPALLLLITVFGFAGAALLNTFSRYQENQADIYSLEVTHGIIPDPGQDCAASYQKFGEEVVVDPHPNPINVVLFFDHPPVSDRVHLCATYDPWSHGESPKFVK